MTTAPTTLLRTHDLCAGYNGNVSLNGTTYYIQSEYSNYYSACAWST